MSEDDWAPVAPENCKYGNPVEFFVQYLGKVYMRQITDTSDTVWCPDWYRHPEALARVDALWQAFESARNHGGPGMSRWFRDHADWHMERLFDPKGPFKYCSVRNGHKDMLSRLPSGPEVEALYPDAPALNDPEAPDTELEWTA
ncbi:DUF4913 domain-containing protein [Nocardia thailandica]|uniref:DUF4913 domain-containing protein n=1 Tax=Nocardia thailandica TaxID=257275 RepID=A0ABW6PPH3_9NOCA|nr:DUF4913 domain-containing protein [Nocardia thailandica]